MQNEAARLTTDQKIEFIERLSRTGLRCIEATAFCSPRALPPLADAEAVMQRLHHSPDVRYPVLVPNRTGLDRAIAAGVRDIAVFTAASDTFCRKNIHQGMESSLRSFRPMIRHALNHGIRVRGYVSCALGCPYEGEVPVARVVTIASELLDAGCAEIALGDTTGGGAPLLAQTTLCAVAHHIPVERIGVHFHDTWGQALSNILVCLRQGVRTVDASVAGLGGCPYAPGAGGNVATEDLVYMLQGMGIETGVDLGALADIGNDICALLGRDTRSKAAQALNAKGAMPCGSKG